MLCREATNQNRNSLVYDPVGDSRWYDAGASYVTDDAETFMQLVRQNRNCTVFVDEAGDFCTSYDRDSHWLATRARHLGHQSVFISQRPTMVAKNIRDNCDKLFCFRISKYDAKEMANDYVCDDLLAAPELAKGECIFLKRYEPAIKLNIFT